MRFLGCAGRSAIGRRVRRSLGISVFWGPIAFLCFGALFHLVVAAACLSALACTCLLLLGFPVGIPRHSGCRCRCRCRRLQPRVLRRAASRLLC